METTKTYSASDLFTLANRIRKQNGVSQKEAFAMAKAQLTAPKTEEPSTPSVDTKDLLARMKKGNVKFTFRNNKGRECTTTGTLRMEKVPSNRKVQGKQDKRNDNMCVFYDVRHGVYRQFDLNSVVSVYNKKK